MKTKTVTAIALAFTLLTFASAAEARDTYVNGYTKSNGTYVAPYHRTSADNTVNNNYGTSGNSNPYTGENGHRARNPSQPAGEYNAGNSMGQ